MTALTDITHLYFTVTTTVEETKDLRKTAKFKQTTDDAPC